MTVVNPGKYQHYKGKFYQVLGTATHSETKEKIIVYKGLYDDPELGKEPLFVRPEKMFFETVTVDGKIVPRFQSIHSAAESDSLFTLLAFIQEAEKLKLVERQILLSSQNRLESTAEHSWHLAFAALLLERHLVGVNIEKILKLALIHDLVELYAGDTFAFDKEGRKSKEERELQAQQRIIAQLPSPQKEDLQHLFEEYERGNSKEAQYVQSFDKLLALVQNIASEGKCWEEHHITLPDIEQHKRKLMEHDPLMMKLYQKLLQEALNLGFLKEVL